VAEVGEALLGEKLEGFFVAGYGSDAEVFDAPVLGFCDDCFHEGFADAFSSVVLGDDGGFDFGFGACSHEAGEGDDCVVVGCDPDVVGADFGEVFVEVFAGVWSAYVWALVDVSVVLCEFCPEGSAGVEVLGLVFADGGGHGVFSCCWGFIV